MKKASLSEGFKLKMQRLSGLLEEDQKDRLQYLKNQWDQYYNGIADKFKTTGEFSLNLKKRLFDRDTKHLLTTGDLGQLLNPEMLNNKAKLLKTTDEIFKNIVAADPSPEKAKLYTSWLLDLFKANQLKMEDLYKATEYLTLFDKVKHLLPLEQRNIDAYDGLSNLYSSIKPYEKKEIVSNSELERQEKLKGADKLLDGSKWMILTPKTQEGACLYGKGTKWCTAAKSNNYFNHYNKQGPLYILINKSNQSDKYQFHFESNQFMDDEDRSIPIGDFLRENPEVTDFFKKIGKVNNAFLLKHQGYAKEEALRILMDPKEQPSLLKNNGLEWFFNYFVKLNEAKLLSQIVGGYDFLKSLSESGTALQLFKLFNSNDSKVKSIIAEGAQEFVENIVNDEKKRALMTDYFIKSVIDLANNGKSANSDPVSEPMSTFANSSKIGYEYIYNLIRLQGPIYNELVVKLKDYSTYLTCLSFANVWGGKLNDMGRQFMEDPNIKKEFIKQQGKEIYELVFDMFV